MDRGTHQHLSQFCPGRAKILDIYKESHMRSIEILIQLLSDLIIAQSQEQTILFLLIKLHLLPNPQNRTIIPHIYIYHYFRKLQTQTTTPNRFFLHSFGSILSLLLMQPLALESDTQNKLHRVPSAAPFMRPSLLQQSNEKENHPYDDVCSENAAPTYFNPSEPQNSGPSANNRYQGLTYQQLLMRMFRENRLFFYHELFSGNYTRRIAGRFNCTFLLGMAQAAREFLTWLLSLVTFSFIPLVLRPFLIGMFFPLYLLFSINYEYLYWLVFIPADAELVTFFTTLISEMTLFMFCMAACRGSGSLSKAVYRETSTKIIRNCPFLTSSRTYCEDCNLVKALRSHHCTSCNICVPKYSKHSLLMNICVGASNQFYYMFFLFLLVLNQILTLFLLFCYSSTILMEGVQSFDVFIFLINIWIFKLAVVEFSQIFIINFWYGVTPHEVENWIHKPEFRYTNGIDDKVQGFCNPYNLGFKRNLKESLIAGFSNFERIEVLPDMMSGDPEALICQPLDWSIAFYYHASQIPTHPNQSYLRGNFLAQIQLCKKRRQSFSNAQASMGIETDSLRPQHLTQLVKMQVSKTEVIGFDISQVESQERNTVEIGGRSSIKGILSERNENAVMINPGTTKKQLKP